MVKWDGGGSEEGKTIPGIGNEQCLRTQSRRHFGSSKVLREVQWCQMGLGAGQWSDHVEPHGPCEHLPFTLRTARSSGRVFRRALGIVRFEFCKAYFGCVIHGECSVVETDVENSGASCSSGGRHGEYLGL